MDIDLSILRMLEREKEISFEVLCDAIEQALLLTAYLKTPGAQEQARVSLDRKTGHVVVMAYELDEEGTKVGEYEDTPEGFGRIAATTAKQIMRSASATPRTNCGSASFSARRGTSSPG